MTDAGQLNRLAEQFYNAVARYIDQDDDAYGAFYGALTPEEDRAILAATMTDMGGGVWDGKSPDEWDYVSLAEIHAAALTRAGREEALRPLVPAAAKNPDVSAALEAKAPAFAKLLQ